MQMIYGRIIHKIEIDIFVKKLISIIFKFFNYYFLISNRNLENDILKLKLIKKS